MSLNIKNAATYALIKELAETTGETMTGAVTQAVRERLARLRGEGGDAELRIERVLVLAGEIGDRLPEPYRSADHGELLYDDLGLPR
jgi:antitoxin VapB